MVSENTIFFYSGRGGHSHDGENSSFIDTSKYSLFDFSWGLLGDPDRQASQDRNYNSFKDFIINTVNQSILNPAGLVLQPGIVNGSAHIISRSLTTELIAANAITANEILANTITANEIAANTITANEIAANAITANELAANLVLVNNIIRSNNFDGNIAANGAITSAGTVGWAVSGHGQAVFDTTFIRGSLVASSVSTPGVDIDANGNLTANTFALYANGAIVTSSGNFQVSADGNLYAENAEIYGEINASLGSIGAWSIDANGIYNVGAGGRSVALYPAIGSTSDAVFEVDFGDYSARIAAGIISVSAPGASTFMGAGTFQATTNIAVGAYVAIDENNRHYAYSIRPIVTGAQPTYVDITGSGWKYNATNLTHDGFPMAFGWRNSGGRLTFVVNNDGAVSGTITNTITSDRRVKDNIRNVSTSVLDNFYSINTYEFDWNEKAPQWLQDRSCGVGVIADELKILYPEAVIDDYAYEGWVHRYSEHPEGFSLEEMELFGSDFYEFVPGEGVWQKPRYASVDYTVLIPHLISAIHDLNNRVKELESKV
jgi:hypothetical protein